VSLTCKYTKAIETGLLNFTIIVIFAAMSNKLQLFRSIENHFLLLIFVRIVPICLVGFLFLQKIHGQTTPPAAPLFYKVTVNPYEGIDTIIWYSSKNADYYRINVVVYDVPLNPYTNDSIDFVRAPDTVYINRNTNSSLRPVGYSIAAVDEAGNTTLRSVFNVPDSTIHLGAEFDSCTRKITFRWNDYNTWRGSIEKYLLYEVSGGVPALVSEFQAPQQKIMLYEMQMTESFRKSFFVVAVHSDGRTSASNMAEISADIIIPKPPAFITANRVEMSDGKITITFSVDPASEMTNYKILRSRSSDGEFQPVHELQTTGKTIVYSDEVNDLAGIYFYRLQCFDYCMNFVLESNIINNIILSGVNSGVVNVLEWNAVEDPNGETEEYILYWQNIGNQTVPDSIDLSSQQSFEHNLQGFFDDVDTQSGRFCYRIKAVGSDSRKITVFSNQVCLDVLPEIVLPNAFIPDNPNGVNDIFKPLFIFEPLEYEMIIYNRWGNKIWEGKNTGWDGKIKSKPAQEGMYVYHIRVTFKGREKQEKTGYVTVIYR
jgi:gliding motility-associated-like protein